MDKISDFMLEPDSIPDSTMLKNKFYWIAENRKNGALGQLFDELLFISKSINAVYHDITKERVAAGFQTLQHTFEYDHLSAWSMKRWCWGLLKALPKPSDYPTKSSWLGGVMRYALTAPYAAFVNFIMRPIHVLFDMWWMGMAYLWSLITATRW